MTTMMTKRSTASTRKALYISPPELQGIQPVGVAVGAGGEEISLDNNSLLIQE